MSLKIKNFIAWSIIHLLYLTHVIKLKFVPTLSVINKHDGTTMNYNVKLFTRTTVYGGLKKNPQINYLNRNPTRIFNIFQSNRRKERSGK